MRASLLPLPYFSTLLRDRVAQDLNRGLTKLISHRVECVLLGGMVSGVCLVSGAAFCVLTNPNLGQQLTPVSLLKPGALDKGSMSSMGDALLELSKPLKIEVITAPDPSQAAALTIVSPAEFQPQLLEQTHNRGIRLLLITLAAGGLLAAVVRIGPNLPIWPQRRKPLGERIDKREVSDHPLSVKRAIAPPLSAATPQPRSKRSVPVGATQVPAAESVLLPLDISQNPTVPMAHRPFAHNPSLKGDTAPQRLGKRAKGHAPQKHRNHSVVMTAHVNRSASSEAALPSPGKVQPRRDITAVPQASPSWLSELDLRQTSPIDSLI